MRKICILAVAILSLALASSAAAQVVPVNLSFNWAVLNTPGFKNVVLVSPKTMPITAKASFDQSTGTFTIAPADFSFPRYSFTTPVPGTLDVSLNGPANGQFNPATGALSLTADLLATVNLTGVGTCTGDTGSQTYSTSNSTVYPGVPFPATASGPVTGPGAFTGGWQSVPSMGSACGLVSPALNGPGGLWISKDIAPPSPKLSVSAAPKKATESVGQSTTIKVTVRNTGKLAASAVSVCTTAPKAVHATRANCKMIASLAAGAKKTLRVKLAGTAVGTFTVKFTAKETGVKSAHTTVSLKVT